MEYWNEKTLRGFTCWQCKHCAKTSDLNGKPTRKPQKSLCALTKRWGSLNRGRCCERFEYFQWNKSVADDGLEIKNRQPLDYRTEKQWLACGRRLKPSAVGKEMHASRHNMKTVFRYYLIEETEECLKTKTLK